MAVFGLLRRRRPNDDRPAAERSSKGGSTRIDSRRFRRELASYIENLLANRLMISASQEIAFEAEAQALMESTHQLSPDADESEIFHLWDRIKELASSRSRNEKIFAEGRFFEYQQLLFEFSKMIRQMESVREVTLKQASRIANGKGDVGDDDVARIRSLLEKENRELRSFNSAVSDRLQALRQILLEDRKPPEVDSETQLLAQETFDSSISRYIRISSCTNEVLHLISFQIADATNISVLAQAVSQTFKRHADCKGRTDDTTVSVLTLNVKHRKLLELAQTVSEFVTSTDLPAPAVFLAKGRFDDTPGLLRERLSKVD
ncbi:MAG: hypothetical protein HKN43_04000 [Rhodothermales bacterium]|nr:hypothetical protein [Rhodothermales bacterium]